VPGVSQHINPAIAIMLIQMQSFQLIYNSSHLAALRWIVKPGSRESIILEIALRRMPSLVKRFSVASSPICNFVFYLTGSKDTPEMSFALNWQLAL